MTPENILVVKKTILFDSPPFQGLCTEVEPYLEIIHDAHEFLPRPQMEEDFNYKQIIPYLVFKCEDRYFLMQRASDSSEQRLKNKYSLGIGGHMRQTDLQNGATIFDWAQREFQEEIDYRGEVTITTIGILNDDSNPVGQVHMGLVLLLTGNSTDISIKSELKSGQLLTLDECKIHYDQMESWSQIIFTMLNI
jgi:predicted NUDIX family phosphoesterase